MRRAIRSFLKKKPSKGHQTFVRSEQDTKDIPHEINDAFKLSDFNLSSTEGIASSSDTRIYDSLLTLDNDNHEAILATNCSSSSGEINNGRFNVAEQIVVTPLRPRPRPRPGHQTELEHSRSYRSAASCHHFNTVDSPSEMQRHHSLKHTSCQENNQIPNTCYLRTEEIHDPRGTMSYAKALIQRCQDEMEYRLNVNISNNVRSFTEGYHMDSHDQPRAEANVRRFGYQTERLPNTLARAQITETSANRLSIPEFGTYPPPATSRDSRDTSNLGFITIASDHSHFSSSSTAGTITTTFNLGPDISVEFTEILQTSDSHMSCSNNPVKKNYSIFPRSPFRRRELMARFKDPTLETRTSTMKKIESHECAFCKDQINDSMNDTNKGRTIVIASK